MTAPLVLFDHGHTGRASRVPPAKWLGLKENIISSAYLGTCQRQLLGAGYDAAHVGAGPYLERQERCRELGAVAYVAAHVNSGAAALRDAGNPRRHIVFYDHRSGAGAGGNALANAIAAQCERLFPGTPWVAKPCQPNHWTQNAFFLIKETGNAAAVVFEPGFIDEMEHQYLWTPEGTHKLGTGLANGIVAYLKGRSHAS